MARVTYGALITELAGSIGGITFHKNSSGNIARLKPNMPMVASPAQNDQQYKLNSLIAIWPTLTLVQKTSWNNLATAHDHINEFGETKTLNGFQWFMSCNLNLLTVGENVILSAPAYAPPAAPGPFIISDGSNNFNVHFIPNWSSPDNYYIVYASSPLRQSSLKKRSYFLSLGSVIMVDANWLYIQALYESTFNLSYPSLYNNGNCTIIVRVKVLQPGTGLSSPYTSALIKIG